LEPARASRSESFAAVRNSMGPFLTTFALCFFLTLSGCSKSRTASSPPETQPEKSATPASASSSANAAPIKPQIDSCSLLTNQEITSIQGAAPTEAKPSTRLGGGLSVSQCYFLLPIAADSIVLTLTQRGDGPGARDPKESWQEIFHVEHENVKAREEKDKEPAKPQSVPGLGDEAFWSPTRVGGVLYVLKGNNYLSISVGGAADQTTRLQKSQSLAELALKHF
jgi:hypothetical protein